jgi:hypothetical protein
MARKHFFCLFFLPWRPCLPFSLVDAAQPCCESPAQGDSRPSYPWTKYLQNKTPKCRLFLKIDQLRYLATGAYISEAPSPPRFLFGVVPQFCRFGIWSNTQCITLNMLSTQPNPLPPCYTLYIGGGGGGGGGGELERR